MVKQDVAGDRILPIGHSPAAGLMDHVWTAEEIAALLDKPTDYLFLATGSRSKTGGFLCQWNRGM
jgi:hypothetical protein